MYCGGRRSYRGYWEEVMSRDWGGGLVEGLGRRSGDRPGRGLVGNT